MSERNIKKTVNNIYNFNCCNKNKGSKIPEQNIKETKKNFMKDILDCYTKITALITLDLYFYLYVYNAWKLKENFDIGLFAGLLIVFISFLLMTVIAIIYTYNVLKDGVELKKLGGIGIFGLLPFCLPIIVSAFFLVMLYVVGINKFMNIFS